MSDPTPPKSATQTEKSPDDSHIIGDNQAYERGLRALNILGNMTGLADVVEQISQIIASNIVEGELSLSARLLNTQSRHMLFQGNPGTGKTTAARLMGDIFRASDILDKGHLIEAKGSQLIGQYVGQTAPKVKKLCEKAYGGVLFIDEAYSLVAEGQSFGADALAELISIMEDKRDDFIVILAGYPNEMKKLMEFNPGLTSRVPYSINFRDYTEAELQTIIRKMGSERKVAFEQGLVPRLSEHLMSTKQNSEAVFGNARDARNIVQHMIDAASMDFFGSKRGVPRLREIMSMASGRKEVPVMDEVVIGHRHFDAFLESKGGLPAKTFQMGFDLRPHYP